jgi:signal transduction histidine kinase
MVAFFVLCCNYVPMNTQEVEVRREALLTITGVASLASLFYLALGSTGGWYSRLFPWDGLWLLAMGLLFGFLTWKFPRSPLYIGTYAAWFLALASQPLFYASQQYGIQHPIMALFVLSILAGGLLVGENFMFLGMWVGFFSFWVVLIGIGQLNGQWAREYPITLASMLTYSAFWCTVYVGTGGLGWFFARYLKRALDSSYQQTQTLTQSLNVLAEGSGMEPFVGRVLGVVVKQFGVDFAPLFLYKEESRLLQFHLAYMAGQIQTEDTNGNQAPPPVPASLSPLWQELLATRQPIFIADPATDPRILNQALLKGQGVKTLMAVPMVLGEKVLGYFALNTLTPRRYQREEVNLLRSLAQLITLAVELTRMAEQGQEHAIVAERNRMAREIHDTLAQGFTGIVMQLEAAEDALEDGVSADVHLQRAKGLARESLAEARRSVHALRPALLEQSHWIEALQNSTYRLTQNSGIAIAWEITPDLPALSPTIETELYRIGQEALTNVVRHARARHVRVAVGHDDTHLWLEVRDDGIGYVPYGRESGFGLVGMHERATKIGATLTITGATPQGTTVRVIVPTRSSLPTAEQQP